MNFTPEQLLEIESGKAVRLVEPALRSECVVVRADVYDRVRALIEGGDELAIDRFYPLLAEIRPEDWEDASAYGLSDAVP